MASWLGLDIGTSSLKALQVAEDGTVLARASVHYRTAPGARATAAPEAPDTMGTRTTTYEQHPDIWVEAAARAIAECAAQAGPPDGVGVAGHVPSLVLLDGDFTPIRPCITWQDNRATTEAGELADRFGDPTDLIGMNLPWSASHLPAKLRWIAHHEPENLERTRYAIQPKDYVVYHLTGEVVSDVWSMKGAVDIRTGKPAAEILAASGWNPQTIARTDDPWTTAGRTTTSALGLPPGIPVAVGWSDALASMLAIGVFSQPCAFIQTGTSEIVGMSVQGAHPHAPGLYSIPADCAPKAVIYGPTQSSGGTVEWLSRLFERPVPDLLELAQNATVRPTVPPPTPDGGSTSVGAPAPNSMDAAIAAANQPPVFVPYLTGERAPLWQPQLRALFAGIGEQDGSAELTRSVLHGIASTASHILDVASTGVGETFSEVHVAGRGADHPVWQQLRLETLGVPILFHRETYVSALGAAMLGAAAAHDGDLAQADRLRTAPHRVEPSEQQRAERIVHLERFMRASQLAGIWSTP